MMLSIATLNPSTTFNHSPYYTVCRILNRYSFLPSTFSLLSKFNPYSSSSTYKPLCMRAIDAAQLFDYESKLAKDFTVSQHFKIAIVSFANFGQFLAATLVRQSHTIFAHSCSDHSAIARKLGVLFFQNPDNLCEEHPEVILLCSSIISTERVLLTLPLQRLKRSTLFVDVIPVKEFPKKLLLELLPFDFGSLCTHPMFGPMSASDGWTSLSFVFEKVRILDEEHRVSRYEKFLNAFVREGCRMVEMSCEDHDHYAACSQLITHTGGRILEGLMLESMPINTKGNLLCGL